MLFKLLKKKQQFYCSRAQDMFFLFVYLQRKAAFVRTALERILASTVFNLRLLPAQNKMFYQTTFCILLLYKGNKSLSVTH